jgi:hypothetical protein
VAIANTAENEIRTRPNPPNMIKTMKRYFEQKLIADSVRDVSETSRKVKVAISQMGSKDFDNDVIDHGATTRLWLKEVLRVLILFGT